MSYCRSVIFILMDLSLCNRVANFRGNDLRVIEFSRNEKVDY